MARNKNKIRRPMHFASAVLGVATLALSFQGVSYSSASEATMGVNTQGHAPAAVSSSPFDSAINSSITVSPTVSNRSDGGRQTTYRLPDGEQMVVTTPPAGFDPLAASNRALMEYGFPTRPTDSLALRDWTRVMQAFKSDEAPYGSLDFATDPTATKFSTIYSNWGGYIDGTMNTQSNTYVAVKGEFTVPGVTGTTCSSAHNNTIGAWIGLGGTSSATNDLVQQGLLCGDAAVVGDGAWRPFEEFANTANPVAFCGYTSWTFPVGDVVYQNMSFQTSSNVANFFIQDITTGTAHSCTVSPPSGWSYDLNTAEWIVEAPTGTAADFGSFAFIDANAELGSNSSWVTMGSQSNTKTIDGSSSTTYCIVPGNIGSDSQSFTDQWHASTC